jgi:penicillin-binding protein 1A
MASDDRKERPFFHRGGRRRSLVDSIDDRAGDAFGDQPSALEEHARSFGSDEPLPSFLRKEQAAQGIKPLQRKDAPPPQKPHPYYKPHGEDDEAEDAPHERASLPKRLTRAFRRKERDGRKGPKTPRSWPFRAAVFTLYWGTIAAIWFAVILASAVTVYSLMAEDPLKAGLSKQPAKITVVAENGNVLAEKGLRRSHVKLADMPPHLVEAVLSTEDRRYYYHYGFDPIGIARAFIRNYQAGRVVEGGSTITQQLVKVLFLKPDRTYLRKVEEMLLSLSLEYRFEKHQILELYLNRIYFGAGNYGVEAAAQHYFGKKVGEIDVYESAILAGLIRSPTYYAPTNNLERSLERARVVLNLMRSHGAITLEEYDTALANPPGLRNYLPSQSYGYVIDWVMQQLPELGLDLEADVTVETTLDYELQATAQRIVTEKMAQQAGDYNAGEAAAVILDRNGAVRAMVGGRDYKKNQFNRAVQARRQPGSTFKPFVFLAALEKGLTPDSQVHDGPLRIGTWTPANYNDRYHGDVTLREALAKSMNTAAVRLSEWAGRDAVLKTAHRLGITSKLAQNASIALGTSEVSLLELASAYVPFANGGFSAMPHVIKTVKNAEGQVVYDVGRTNWGRVVRPNHVAAMNDMLTATIQYGTGNKASIDPHPAAGKTGTGQDYRDAWFIGYSAHYVTGVWLGNDDYTPMKRVTGGSLPTLIWHDLMTYAHLQKEPAFLPGGEHLVARGNQPFDTPQRPRNDNFWDTLFGGTGSAGASDTTLGTPVASSRQEKPKAKNWLEDFFSQ